MEIKKKSWNDITIADYRKIDSIINDDVAIPVEKDMSILAILCDVDEEEIWGMKVEEINNLRFKLDFLDNFDFSKKNLKNITVNGQKCKVMVDLNEMTVAQYVDFQEYWKDWKNNMEKVLSVFLIPEGKKYGDGYDIQQLQQDILNNIPITTANSICFFFLKKLLSSIKATKTYLALMTKSAKKMKNKEIQQKITELQKEIACLCG